MKTIFDSFQFFRFAVLIFFAALVSAPFQVHAESEIGLSGLRMGMSVDQALSILVARGIRPERKPGNWHKGEQLEFYLNDSTIAEPIWVKLEFSERDAMRLYAMELYASEKSGLQQFFSWLEKVYVSRRFVEIRRGSNIAINYCVSSRLEVGLYLNVDGASTLRYEGGPTDVPRCKVGPYLGEKASVVYSIPLKKYESSIVSEQTTKSFQPIIKEQPKLWIAKSADQYNALLVCFAEEAEFWGGSLRRMNSAPDGPNVPMTRYIAQAELEFTIGFFEPHFRASAQFLGRSTETSTSDFANVVARVQGYAPPNAQDPKNWRRCNRQIIYNICKAVDATDENRFCSEK